MKFTGISFLALLAAVSAADLQQTANPIRKVVTMLQMMGNKVKAEGEKEKELFDKFMCYCENADETLGKSIEEAKNKVPQVSSELEEAIALKAQLEEELAKHRQDREDAKAAMAKATKIREKEAAEYAKEAGEMKANLDAMAKAIAAIEKGMTGFLQTSAGVMLQKLLKSGNNHAMDALADNDREILMSFISEKQGAEVDTDYAPQSGEIVGILKQMRDTMAGDLKDTMGAEDAAIKAYEELMAAKEKEIAAATAAIEAKLKRLGETSVLIVQLKNDLEDTQEALAEDTKFLADLAKNCALKKKEWALRQKTRSEELLALADTIKLLNDDDALELFKKTLPSAAASSLLQVETTSEMIKHRALLLIQGMRSSMKLNAPRLEYITLALRGKKVGFEKVIKLIDDMVVTLKQEQLDDEAKRDYCRATLDAADDKKKETEHAIADLETQIADAEEAVQTLGDEIKALQDGIAALDKQVAQATEQRKEENAEFTELMASNTAAKQLIGIAKNRMNKFYNPKLYKPPPKRELTEEERITLNMGGTLAPTPPPGGIAGTGVTVLADVKEHRADPGPPPETFGEYKKKGEESNGVIAMMDGLIAELDKEMTEAQAEEKDAQGDYEQFMSDSTDKRAEDSKSVTEKSEAKATNEADLEAAKEAKRSSEKDLGAVVTMIQDLHKDCDFLLENYELRQSARSDEIDALNKAKAVLSGADYSFLQTSDASKSLRR